MPTIGFHASHEQFAPGELLRLAVAAEAAGFDCVMSSDHFTPWSERQGQSAFTWAWLGAAMQATTIPFGLITVPMGWRYHPAITAQAAATIAEMFPGRLAYLALGTGQAMNEHIVGERWPSKAERNARLGEAVGIVRDLFAGETVTRMGPIPTDEAKLYVRPERLPPLIAGALSAETARFAGSWADGLITINQPKKDLEAIIAAFREGGGAGKPLFLQVHVSYAETETEARANAFDQWRSNTLPAPVAETLRTPAEFDGATKHVRPEDLGPYVRISADPARHAEWIAEDLALGFETVILHNVGRNQRAYIEAFEAKIRPALGPLG